MLTFLGINQTAEQEFRSRYIYKEAPDTLDFVDISIPRTISKVNVFANQTVYGDYKETNGVKSRSFPILDVGGSNLGDFNNVGNYSPDIPAVMSIPFYNLNRGDGKGFSINLGGNPVKLKVFQDASSSTCNRLTISTIGVINFNQPQEKNTLNLWANGMVSIGETLNTATYPSEGLFGDEALNPFSLLVQNDISSGTSGLKADSRARLHIKASSAEYNASRAIAWFDIGDGTNAVAINHLGEYICSRAGSGIILKDAINGGLYRFNISGGIAQINQIA